jgi:hypothetical protein
MSIETQGQFVHGRSRVALCGAAYPQHGFVVDRLAQVEVGSRLHAQRPHHHLLYRSSICQRVDRENRVSDGSKRQDPSQFRVSLLQLAGAQEQRIGVSFLAEILKILQFKARALTSAAARSSLGSP